MHIDKFAYVSKFAKMQIFLTVCKELWKEYTLSKMSKKTKGILRQKGDDCISEQKASLKKILVESYRAMGSLNDSLQSSNFLLLLLFFIDFSQR